MAGDDVYNCSGLVECGVAGLKPLPCPGYINELGGVVYPGFRREVP